MPRQGAIATDGRRRRLMDLCCWLREPRMGLCAASKHAIEGLSETLDHEVRQFGVRVVLVEPGYAKTALDNNAPHAASRVEPYGPERDLVARKIAQNVNGAPEPEGVANTIVAAAFCKWKMRRPPKGRAALLSKLRRFLPAGPVDASIRKDFGLA
jgi:NAD(P)-dependent dehydrogenase (short-subunit alcohol dehydrogenase family)